MAHSIEIDVVRVQAPLSRRGLNAHGGSAGVSQAVKGRLEEVDLSPPGLPPQAVLVIKSLADPLPGQFDSTRPGGTWERAVKARLDLVYRRAARPALGRVPEDAEAVLFADPAEMLTCLALDVRLGLAHQRWWWKTLLRRPGGLALAGSSWHGQEDGTAPAPAAFSADLVLLLESQAFEVPAVLARLAQNGLAESVLGGLSHAQAWRILQAVLRAYRLPELPPPPPGTPAALPPFTNPSALPPGMDRTRTVLLGLTLALHARPGLVSSPTFQQRLLRWWLTAQPARKSLQARSRGETAPDQNQNIPSTPLQAPSTTRRTADFLTSPPEPAFAGAADALIAPPAAPPSAADQSHQAAASAHPPGAPARLNSPGTADPVYTSYPGSPIPDHTQPSSPGAPHPHAADAELPAGSVLLNAAQDSPWDVQGISTRLGGMLYLVNLMLALDLPTCFEDGWRLRSGVGAWGLLEALGRELLGSSLAQFEQDPLWALLASLDGRRPGSLPGARLPRSRPRRMPPFHLPSAWLKGLPQVEPTPLSHSRRSALRRTYPPLLAGWLVRALPWIQRRLALALGAGDTADPGPEFLTLSARIFASGAHLDLTASVEDIDLTARLAGLDRDPGWQPDFGRAIYFHFE